jgi:type IV secretion system protein TrbE
VFSADQLDRWHREAYMDEPLSFILPYRRPIGDGGLDLAGNGVLTAAHLVGPPPETSDDADLANCVQLLGRGIGLLNTRDTLQILFHRLQAPEPPKLQFEHEAAQVVHDELRALWKGQEHWLTIGQLFLHHTFEPPVRSTIKAMLLASDPTRKGKQAILRDQALKRFAAFAKAVSGAIHLKPMTYLEMFRALLLAVTYHTFPAPLPEARVPWHKVIACERQVNGYYPIVNRWHLRPVVITQFPAETTPQILKTLLEQPGHLTISARYEALNSYDAQRALEDEQPHWKQSMVGSIVNIAKGWLGINDDSHQDSQNQLDDIDDAMADAASGTPFGRATITAIVRDRDPDLADMMANTLIEACHNSTSGPMLARLEDVNAAEAIAGSYPGHIILDGKEHVANQRKILITGFNFADAVLPGSHYPGEQYIQSELFPPQTHTPLVISGPSLEPFFWPTHAEAANPHQLWLGPTGVGKSMTLWFLAVALLGIHDSRIVALDYGYSSYVIAHLLNGEYHDVGAPDSVPLCPLAMLDEPGGLQWLMGFFKRMFKRWDLELRERQWDDFRDNLVKAKTGTDYLGQPLRQLVDFRGLIQPNTPDDERVREILQQYCLPPHLGGYGHIFNGKPSTNPNQRLIVYEMQNLGSDKQVCAPATELILRRTISSLDGRPTWMLIDEMHRSLSDETAAPELERSLREMRRSNCALVGATQSTIEIANSPIRQLLIDNMGAMIFLANHRATNPDAMDALFKLGVTQNEVACIASSIPRRELLYKSAHGSRKVVIEAGPLGQAIVGSTDTLNVRLARDLVKDGKLSLDDWLEAKGQQSLHKSAA